MLEIKRDTGILIPSLNDLVEIALSKFQATEFEWTPGGNVESYDRFVAASYTIEEYLKAGVNVYELTARLIKESELKFSEMLNFKSMVEEKDYNDWERMSALLSKDILFQELSKKHPEILEEERRRYEEYNGF